MASWGELLKEFQASTPDAVRRKYLGLLSKHTGRPVILYATKWTQPDAPDPGLISITDEDMQGFMEVVRGLPLGNLDIILHSPGGSPTATEAIVDYLRARFTHIRVFVPQAAMSAATMLSCAANEIVMGQHSSLGPIDPQLVMRVNGTPQALPAQAILDQFRMAQQECQDQRKLASWMPILNQYGPALLVQCKNAQKLTLQLVRSWLAKYMFSGRPRKEALVKARKIAAMLGNHNKHFAHSRHLSREICRTKGMLITNLEADQTLQDLVLSVYHAASLTFTNTPATKIIENELGRAFVKISQVSLVPQMVQRPGQIPVPMRRPVPAPIPAPVQPPVAPPVPVQPPPAPDNTPPTT